MGRRTCTEPQCLYKSVLYLFIKPIMWWCGIPRPLTPRNDNLITNSYCSCSSSRSVQRLSTVNCEEDCGKDKFFFAHNSVCESYNVTKWIWTKITAKWKREKDDSFTTLPINLCDEPCSVANSSARRQALDCPVFRLSNCQLIDIFVNCNWVDTRSQ